MSSSSEIRLASSATLRGRTLVLSLTDAVVPVVWQLDLGQIKVSAFDVIPVDGQGFVLRLNLSQGELQDIAVYADRATAVMVLTLIHEALAGSVTPVQTIGVVHAGQEGVRTACCQPSRGVRVVKWMMIVFFIFILLLGLGSLMLSSGESLPQTKGMVQAPLGEPMSADDLLKGRGP